MSEELSGDIPPKNKVCCANCRWYCTRTGFCRYNPPQVQMQYVNRIAYPTAIFPKISVPAADWCGQFRNRQI